MDETADKKSYEISFLVKNEEDAQQVLKLLKSAGAEIESEGSISRVNLAYPIKKENSLLFGYFHFSLVPGGIKQLSDAAKMNPLIFRFLIITPPFVKNKARTFVPARRRPSAPASTFSQQTERKTSSALSNEALEKQLKEILQ